ncbi:MAG TPA: DUF177 domain-containing protein [Rhizomicrobium sp.]|jgi:uncharacterized metal-binding protein YceD (DUF177 family)|nr:DUF177 domain-containing protein [Rhizomicrobium sp.]
MSGDLPFSHLYNLNRLGQAGDNVHLAVSDADKAALAAFAGVLRIDAFSGAIALKKLSPNRFQLDFTLAADICQACVVTLAEVPAHIERRFSRELHFNPAMRRPSGEAQTADIPLEDDLPEEIDSLHYDLAAPLIEEFVLAIDPYPRAPGVEFAPPADAEEAPESPFAVLKGLKSGL